MSTTASPAVTPSLLTLVRTLRWRPSGEDQPSVGIGSNANLNGTLGGASSLAIVAATGTGTRFVNLIDQEPVMEIVGSGTGVALLRSTSWSLRLIAAQGLATPSLFQPIQRWIFRIGKAAGNGGADFFGIYFHPLAATIPASPGTTGPGWAVCGDGAGGWQFTARKVSGGGLTITQALTGFVNGELTDVEFRIIPATGTVGAILQLYINGGLVLSESWDNGRLPLYSDGVGGSASLNWSIRHQNAAYPNLYWAGVDELSHAAAL